MKYAAWIFHTSWIFHRHCPCFLARTPQLAIWSGRSFFLKKATFYLQLPMGLCARPVLEADGEWSVKVDQDLFYRGVLNKQNFCSCLNPEKCVETDLSLITEHMVQTQLKTLEYSFNSIWKEVVDEWERTTPHPSEERQYTNNFQHSLHWGGTVV